MNRIITILDFNANQVIVRGLPDEIKDVEDYIDRKFNISNKTCAYLISPNIKIDFDVYQ